MCAKCRYEHQYSQVDWVVICKEWVLGLQHRTLWWALFLISFVAVNKSATTQLAPSYLNAPQGKSSNSREFSTDSPNCLLSANPIW